MAASREEIIDMLKASYRMELETVTNYLAYSINPPHFFGCKGNISDLIKCGDPANAGSRTNQSISHFQFFFSIGQSF